MDNEPSVHDPDYREPESNARRIAAATAGFTGSADAARAHLSDPVAKVRAAALVSLVRLGAAGPGDVQGALDDPEPLVRRTACELAPQLSGTSITRMLDDPDPSVVEAAAFASGEIGEHGVVARLAEIAAGHADPLCRESAIAALGAIGDSAGKQAVLDATGDIPAIRRRAVVALAAFTGADVDRALRDRLEDRDWQVRQAAADVLGISGTEPR